MKPKENEEEVVLEEFEETGEVITNLVEEDPEEGDEDKDEEDEPNNGEVGRSPS